MRDVRHFPYLPPFSIVFRWIYYDVYRRHTEFTSDRWLPARLSPREWQQGHYVWRVIHKIQCLLFCRLIDTYIHFATMTIYSENLGLSCRVRGKCSHDVIKRQWRWLALTYWPNYQLSIIDYHKEICWQWVRYAHDLSQ